MSRAAANTLWARAFVDELARCGVREVVCAPGSRSTPLVMALAADARIRTRVHLDERSAAFFALGVGAASGAPAAVLTTSGTATANLFPAVVEATQSERPLLVLTADRPHRLRDADANQAIDQHRLFGVYVRDFFEVAPPALEGPALRHLRTLACRAVAAAAGPPAGPVHLNFPFDKPLEPDSHFGDFADREPLAALGRPDGEPFVRIGRARARLDDAGLGAVAATVGGGRGVIVAGPSPEPGRDGPAARRLAEATGYPLLADPLSGARFACGGARPVAGYDLLLRDPEVRGRLAPSVVVRVGASPTSAATGAWLLEHDGAPQVVIDGGRRWKDHGASATRYVHADVADTLNRLADRIGAPPVSDGWAELWTRAQAAALEAVAGASGEPHEGDVLASVAAALPAGATLFVSSSMPVRDLDAFGLPRDEELRVLGNRGASGIDGIVSSAFGAATALGAPTVCVLGDVALFHDRNGLLWSREPNVPVVFVLVDNDGGGIFHMLPISDHEPAFTRFFATPHGLDFRSTVEAHGIGFADADPAGLAGALTDALATGATRVLRVRSDRAVNRRRHTEIAEAVGRSVRAALG